MNAIPTYVRCPDDGGVLRLATTEITCNSCGRIFPVVSDIPELLPRASLDALSSEAQQLEAYRAGFSQRPDRGWLQPLRLMLGALGNGFLYNWARKAIERIAVGRSLTILDAGCGDGILRSCLAKRHNYVGIDFSLRPLLRAGRYHPADYFRGDLVHLPFASATFDAVVSLQALQYLQNPAEAITQIARVLKPAGYFLLSVPNAGSFKYRYMGLPSLQVQRFHRDRVLKMLSQEFEPIQLQARGLWLPAPMVSIHVPGTYNESQGLAWTVMGSRKR